MKLDIKTDFTSLPRAATYLRAKEAAATVAFDTAPLPHEELRLRRRVLSLSGGGKVLVDLAEPAVLAAGDRLVLDDGRQVEIAAQAEDLVEVRGRDAVHLTEIAWHLGSHHIPVQVETGRLLVFRDAAIEDLLHGVGAAARPVSEPFSPLEGLDFGHHDHHHHDHHHHDHGERDAHGRLPGDPHYGHNHA